VLKESILIEIAERMQKSPAQVALRWGLQSGHSVLPKSTSEARIKENLDLFSWSIPKDLFDKISEINQVYRYLTSLYLSKYSLLNKTLEMVSSAQKKT
jgi:alcohol dehydrogenase (NADP+)